MNNLKRPNNLIDTPQKKLKLNEDSTLDHSKVMNGTKSSLLDRLSGYKLQRK